MPSAMLEHDAQTLGFRESGLTFSLIFSPQQTHTRYIFTMSHYLLNQS